MARPSKSVSTLSGHQSSEEIEARKEQEDKLKGSADKIKPSSYLSAKQKKLFKTIVKELEASGILGNLDIYVLATCSIAIDRLQFIETIINDKPTAIMNKDLMSAKDKYNKDFFRCCNELSLSPQSRAKFGNLTLQAKEKEEDPLLAALRDDD